MAKRAISPKMLEDLKRGALSPLLRAVQEDDTLSLELRGTYFNIYYRGGSLFRVSEGDGGYQLAFDTEYCVHDALPGAPGLREAPGLIPGYKREMDAWFHAHPKYEREAQQMIVRVNNRSGDISQSTDYFIADVEYAEPDAGARFDMAALKWPSTSQARKNTGSPSLSLIELKYGDKALGGAAGIQKHLDDLSAFLRDTAQVEAFATDMGEVFRQKCELGLVSGLVEKQFHVTVSPASPEVILIFAEHDPDKSELKKVLGGVQSGAYSFPIRIASASRMGFGLYESRMMSIKEYLDA